MTTTMDMEVINMNNIQVFIGGIEVVADKNITIKEEMLATPSTILNNCYPKSWEDDHDYYSRFFMPQDYSNCTIYKNGALIFAGVLKNSGSLLLRPTEPKYGSFQILDYKTFLSEGETLDFVIDNKTVEEAIEQVTNAIADYGFVVGNINLTNKDDIINAYSTLNKTAYDVYQYIAEITQSRWFTRIADSEFPLVEMTLNSDGRYYVDGISTQQTRSGRQLYNVNDVQKMTSGITVDEEGWISVSYDNTSGTSTKYFQYFTNNLDLKPNTQYSIITEIKEVSGELTIYCVSRMNNGGQFVNSVSYSFNNPNSNLVYKKLDTTIDNFDNVIYGLRTYVQFSKGQSGSIKFRLSVLEDTTINENNFVYEPYRGMPSPNFPSEIVNTYSAGTYQTLINNYLYTFTINDDLRSIGNIADRLWLDITNNTAEVEKKIGKIVLNGSENWQEFYMTKTNTNVFSINSTYLNNNYQNSYNKITVLSNYFKCHGLGTLYGNDDIEAIELNSNTSYSIQIGISKDIASSVSEFKQWLSENNTDVQYVLKSPTTQNIQLNVENNNRKVAIDFYSPELMPRANDIQYTQEYFENNNIVDISYSYSTSEYRNKQIILSDTVFASIDTNENIIANGFQTNFVTSQSIGLLKEVYVNGVKKTFTTTNNKNIGIFADFYYSSGSNTIEASATYEAGTIINVVYTPLVKGRQIIFNNAEIIRIGTQTGRNGTISRYETRNDVLSTDELGKVAQSYIKYKGEAEIILTVQTKETDLFMIGQQVYFDIPALPELAKDYMVKTKETQIIQTGDYANIFYIYTLSSSFNSETAINYFDNQRRKMNGNIGKDEFISRNIDIENTATLIFSDLQIVEVTPNGDNVLNSILNSPFTN